MKVVVSTALLPYSYEIVLGIGLRQAIDEIRSRFSRCKVFVVTDSNVMKYYGSLFQKKQWITTVIRAGERNKNRRSKELIENQLISHNAGRDSIIIALGGGMIGDLAGFTAATFMRGISYIHIPTTLLSQVDSSIGGKVAINHPQGKNLIGAFHRPFKVYIDISTLHTLPHREFQQGMAEVIKYAAILDSGLFNYLEDHHQQIIFRDDKALLHIIHRCIEIKKHVVEKDERESNFRRVLNFGHTIGHALEAYLRYKLPHGRAVAIGMAVEAELSRKYGLLDKKDLERLKGLISLYHLPSSIPRGIDIARLLTLTSLDKKSYRNNVRYTLLEAIGKARWDVTLSEGRVRRALIR